MDQPTEPLSPFEEARLRVRILPANLGYLRQPRFMVPPVSIRMDVTVASGQPYRIRPWPAKAAGTPTDLKVVLSPERRLWLVVALEGPPTPPGYELLPGTFSVRSSGSRLGIDIRKDAIADLARQLDDVFPDHRVLFRLFPRLAAGRVEHRIDPPHSRVLIAL